MDGSRLAVARCACGITQTTLSNLTGISQSAISKAEKGVSSFTRVQLSAISAATGFPVSYFSDEPIQLAQGRFRKGSKVPAAKQGEVKAKAAAIADVMRAADERYRLLNVTLEPLTKKVDLDGARRAGTDARRVLGVPPTGPVPNVTRALERGGVAVTALPGYVDVGARRLDGFSMWPGMGAEGRRPLVVASVMDRGDVWRATVSHELGHLVLHTRFPESDQEEAEDQAWAFANGFLFPFEDAAALFDGVHPTLGELLKIKAVYGVSVGFLVKCLSGYGIVDPARSTSLWRQMSARGWRSDEPGRVEMEKPKLVPAVLGRMLSEKVEVGLPPILTRQLIALAS